MDAPLPTQTATKPAAAGVAGRTPLRFCYAPAIPHSAAQPLPPGVPVAAFQRYLPLFERQQTDASCSVATATLVLNALLTARGERRVTQGWVVRSDATGAWHDATANQSREGVSLRGLTAHLARLLRQVSVTHQVEAHHVRDAGDDEGCALREALKAFAEGDGNMGLVVNFLQSALLRDGEDVGHMSVVAAYDRAQDRVLVLDVDSTGLLPYWVDVDALLAAMNTQDGGGDTKRGYIIIRPPSSDLCGTVDASQAHHPQRSGEAHEQPIALEHQQ